MCEWVCYRDMGAAGARAAAVAAAAAVSTRIISPTKVLIQHMCLRMYVNFADLVFAMGGVSDGPHIAAQGGM